jgi:lipopolysaccharide/colanic/teichoic acid biosynthesis glycosyltransferase
LASDPLGFDPVPTPELPKLEAVERLGSVVGTTGAGEAVLDLGGLGDVVIDLRDGELAAEPHLELHVVDAPARPAGLPGAGRWELAVKRTIDLVVSTVLLALLLPLLLLVALAIGVSSRGPILFRQRRMGRNGVLIGMFKFRSMRRDAHDGRDELAHLNEATGPVFKIRNDPRVTRVGRLIRRWSIDELPQLVNVLLGQMSLVGPRPPLPEEYETYGSRERRRLSVKPGLTCIWQVSGRSEVDFETWVAMDLEYISSWSLALDLKLLAQTVPAVVRGRGAY